MSLKKVFTNFRVIVMIVCLVLAYVAISPSPWHEGVAIRGVAKNSSASDAGLAPPSASTPPTARERILAINNVPVRTMQDYYQLTSDVAPNTTLIIKTTQNTYALFSRPKYNVTDLGYNRTITVQEETFDEELNETVNVTKIVDVPATEYTLIGTEDLGLRVYEAPKSNLRLGLDLSGGSRVVLKPTKEITLDEMELTIDNINQRLNAFGLTDVFVRQATDLEGNDFIVIEIAGTTKDELSDLARQGNFEARIGNQTVFVGGKDVTYICRTAECSGIDPYVPCAQSNGEWACRFRFSISMTAEAAQRQADITRNLEVVIEGDQNYLSQSIDLFLDQELVDSLRIGAELKGNAQTQISISGSGVGPTQQAAVSDALSNMKRLQAILATGSLPVELEVVKADTISPSLGESFIRNALLIGLVAMAAVVLIVLLRYRSFSVSLPMIIIMISELFIFLGVAAVIGWNLDVAAIAGIIIAIGTGVNDQIVIADETIRSKKSSEVLTWKDKLKRAFFIIFTAYFTILVAMVPLWFAGAGLLRGFAVTTILGVTVGVLITRPAYARIIEIISGE